MIDKPLGAQILASRHFAILFIGTLSLLFIFKKHLEELKEVTYVLFVIVGLFISMLFVMLTDTPAEDVEEWS